MKKFLQSLFKREAQDTIPDKKRLSEVEQRVNDAETAPLSEAQIEEITSGINRVEPAQLVVGAARDTGKMREKNEDSIFVHTSLIGAGTSSLPFGIFIVADGMGGHRYGDVASETAVRSMGTYLVDKLYNSLFSTAPSPPNESLQEIMKKGVLEAHKKITNSAPGGGTTLTAAVTMGTQMTLAHVGDSRAYAVYYDGRMQQLTRDHSLVKRLEELGQITAEEAAVHPQKSMLYRALGQGEAPEPDVFTATLPHPGYLMICSDGLWGVVSEESIFKTIMDSPDLQRACQNMVDSANVLGGPDNITVLLARMSN